MNDLIQYRVLPDLDTYVPTFLDIDPLSIADRDARLRQLVEDPTIHPVQLAYELLEMFSQYDTQRLGGHPPVIDWVSAPGYVVIASVIEELQSPALEIYRRGVVVSAALDTVMQYRKSINRDGTLPVTWVVEVEEPEEWNELLDEFNWIFRGEQADYSTEQEEDEEETSTP